jgi:hypothetical protein
MKGTPSLDANRAEYVPAFCLLDPSDSALANVLTLLAQHEPFASFTTTALASAVRRQLQSTSHVAAIEPDGTLVAYAGWVLTSIELAEGWLADGRGLRTTPSPNDAAALTIVVSPSPGVVRGLLRAARQRNPGRKIFFKRDYPQTLQPSKRSMVWNWRQR